MMTYFSNWIAKYLVKRNIIEESKVLTMNVLLSHISSAIGILLMGWVTDTFILSFLFMFSFTVLRHYAGGFLFAQNFLSCVSASLLYLACMTIHNAVDSTNIILLIACGLALLIMYKLSPIVHIDKLLDAERMHRNRLIAQVIVINLLVISCISYEMTIIKYVIISTALLQIVSKGLKDYI